MPAAVGGAGKAGEAGAVLYGRDAQGAYPAGGADRRDAGSGYLCQDGGENGGGRAAGADQGLPPAHGRAVPARASAAAPEGRAPRG